MKEECMKEKMMGKFEEYEVKSAADTLQRAMEIKANAPLMKEVKKILKKKIESIEDLKKLANEKMHEEEDMD